MSSNKKKSFNWEKGNILDEEEYAPVGDVSKEGRPKIARAVHADPVLRKKERDIELKERQSKTYSARAKKIPDENIIAEDTGSGLLSDTETSAAKKLIDAGGKFKGLGRFGKKK
jgi:hypothetical protein